MSRLVLINNKTKTMETIQKVKVRNMKSERSNKEVANQFIITTNEGRYFQSYTSVIAFIPNGNTLLNYDENHQKIVLDTTYWNYSTTTSKYRNQFLGEDTKTTMKKIADGTYKLSDLNY